MKLKALGKYQSYGHVFAMSWLVVFVLTFAFKSWLAFWCVLFLFYLLTSSLFVYFWFKAISAKKWIEIPITTITSGCDPLSSTDINNIETLLEYEYEAEGKKFKSKKIRYPFYLVTNTQRSELFDQIENDCIRTTYVNPSDHGQAVLFTQLNRFDFYASFAFVLSITAATAFSVFQFLEFIGNQ